MLHTFIHINSSLIQIHELFYFHLIGVISYCKEFISVIILCFMKFNAQTLMQMLQSFKKFIRMKIARVNIV